MTAGAAFLVDLAIAATVVEAVVLAAYWITTRRGMPPRELVAFLGAGLGLLVACRVAAMRGPVVALAAAMLLALLLHLWLVVQRWQR